MHINYLYLLYWANTTNSNKQQKILDYGCGSGDVVLEGRKRGLNIYGCDVFYGGSKSRQDVEKAGLLGDTIREINNGKIDFENDCFDLVLSNQVFEHVEDLDSVLKEINCVMKKEGLFLCLFPSKDVIREGHIGIPFVHWFRKKSLIRFIYTLCLRSIGLGYFKKGKSKIQWTRDQLDWIDKYTFYRSKEDIFESFEKYFEINMIEDDYIIFRSKTSKITSWLIYFYRIPLAPLILRFLFKKLAGMVILARKKV